MAKRAFALVIAAFIFTLGLVASGPALSAQGPVATPADQEGPAVEAAHPAHIHEGSCPEPGDVVFPLNDLTPLGIDVAPEVGTDPTPVGMSGTPVSMEVVSDATPVMEEATGVNPAVAESTTTDVAASLDEILGDEHAINVHESPENIENYIACGDITGTSTDGELQIVLEEVNNSGYIGEAHLFDNGDGTTTVTVTLMLSDFDTTGTPEVTPAG